MELSIQKSTLFDNIPFWDEFLCKDRAMGRDNKLKPFIKLFRTPRQYYFYDVNKNSIICISKSIYNYLKGELAFRDLDKADQDRYCLLQAQGYLSEKHIKKLQYCSQNELENLLLNCIEHITLQITQACNLCCGYCPYADMENMVQRHHTSKKMSWETAKTAIDFLLDHSSNSKEIAISFYGGEPTIEFKLVEKVVLYAEELFIGKKLSFALTTNATLLNDDIMKFMAKHNMNILVSMDGPKSIHDKSRRFASGKGSFDIAYSNLKKLVEYYDTSKFLPISINMVIDPRNDFDEIEELLKDPLFNRVMVSSTIIDDMMLTQKNQISENFLQKMQYQEFLGLLSNLHIVEGINVSQLVSPYISVINETYQRLKSGAYELPDTGTPGGPCVPGQHRLFVSTDGTLYPCERVSETSEAMKIGTLKKGFDYKKATALLNISQLTEDNCKNCWALLYCNLCARFADDNGNLTAVAKKRYCSQSCADAESKLRDCILMKEGYSIYGKWHGGDTYE